MRKWVRPCAACRFTGSVVVRLCDRHWLRGILYLAGFRREDDDVQPERHYRKGREDETVRGQPTVRADRGGA